MDTYRIYCKIGDLWHVVAIVKCELDSVSFLNSEICRWELVGSFLDEVEVLDVAS